MRVGVNLARNGSRNVSLTYINGFRLKLKELLEALRNPLFNINILPIHLVYGRNLGDLPGLKAHTAPKSSDRNRLEDLLIVLISIENGKVSAETLEDWNNCFAAAYFKARGSFTMGFTAAIRAFSERIAKDFSGRTAPTIFLNLAVIRNRVMLIGHSGPVTTTVVCSDHVDNFIDLSSSGMKLSTDELRYFQVELHAGDIIFLCPFAPPGWTNQSILEAMSSSPLNVIRYLLNQANGNLQCAVIQLKVGHGEISYRVKPPIIARVNPGIGDVDTPTEPTAEELTEIESRIRSSHSTPDDRLIPPKPAEKKPLIRRRLPADPFPYTIQPKSAAELESDRLSKLAEMGKIDLPVFKSESELAAEAEKEAPEPSAETSPQPESEIVTGAGEASTARERIRKERQLRSSQEWHRDKKQSREKVKRERPVFPLRRILTVFALTILIPLIVGTVVVGLYVSRSNQSNYRVNLKGAIDTAKIAIIQTDPTLVRVSWEKVIEYLNEAHKYGASTAERELRAQANETLDQLEGGIKMRYVFGLAETLPPGTNIVKLESTGKFLFALDESTGSVLRLTQGEKGFMLDKTFSCKPGTYPSYSAPDDADPITVGSLVDFTILPIENALDRLLIGVDRNAHILYCAQNLDGAAEIIEAPAEGWGEIQAIRFANRRLYLLDPTKNAIQSVPYLGRSGIGLQPETYFGTQGPPLYDVIDFSIINTDAFFLRKNGGLVHCDYKGYLPDCAFAETLTSADGTSLIDLLDRGLFALRSNEPPDASLYVFDSDSQSLINATYKLNLLRYLTPDRFSSDSSSESATAFTFFDRATVIWAAGDRLFIGTLP